MPADESDWRLAGQEGSLQEAELTWQRYRASGPTWEHDHCAFCWAKFMDPDFSEAHRQRIARDPEILTEGYTTTAAHPHGAESHWICQTCFTDFAVRFHWNA